MIVTEKLSYLEIRKDEFGVLEKFFNYCQESKDERIGIVNNQFQVLEPLKFFVEATKNQKKKLQLGTALILIRLVLRELENEIPISYTKSHFHGRSVALLTFPTDLIDQIKGLIAAKRLKLVAKRTDRRKRIIRSYKI